MSEETDDEERVKTMLTSVFEEEVNSPPAKSTPYPEVILQSTEHGNKYYTSFQRYTNQFTHDGTVQIAQRWKGSSIDNTQKQIVNCWLAVDSHDGVQEGNASGDRDESRRNIDNASTLFSWSSGEAYIEARKRELLLKNGPKLHHETKKEQKPDEPKPVKAASSRLVKVPRTSTTNKLTKVIDVESNKYIRSRIELIRAHHSEQMSKKVHDRKRKDHELMLSKLKIKEEEYEKSLHPSEPSGKLFFGTLFNFNTIGTSTPTANSDTESIASTIPRTKGASPEPKIKKFPFLPVGNLFGSQEKKKGKDGSVTPDPELIFEVPQNIEETNDNESTHQHEPPPEPPHEPSDPAQVSEENLLAL